MTDLKFLVKLEEKEDRYLNTTDRLDIGLIVTHFMISIRARKELSLMVSIPERFIPKLHKLIRDPSQKPDDQPLKIVSLYLREQLDPEGKYRLKNVLQIEEENQEGCCYFKDVVF